MIANGPGEILDDGKWGALVPVGDVDLMADKIVAILTNADNVTAPDKAWFNRFSADSVVEQYLNLLRFHALKIKSR